MAEIKHIAKQAVKGVPFLQKELARRLSLQTGRVFTTPTTYYVIFSGRCNIECTFCKIRKLVDPTLSGEVMFRIISEAKALSGKGFNISLSGGEPLIYKPLYDALALSRKIGVNFGFTTNGVTLTKAKVEKVIAYDPFNINVSLESVDPAINESLRPMRHGTRKALEGIENLLAEKERTGSRVSIIVKPTIMEQNYRVLPDLVRHFGKHSKVQVNFQPYVGDKGDPFWVRDLDDLRRVFNEIRELRREGYSVMGDKRQYQGFWEYLSDPPMDGHMRHLDLGGEKRNCDIGLRSLFIYPNGDVFFCDFLKQAIGNVHQDSLSKIYYGPVANAQRRKMIHCNIDCQQTCKRPTPLWEKARTFLHMG